MGRKKEMISPEDSYFIVGPTQKYKPIFLVVVSMNMIDRFAFN